MHRKQNPGGNLYKCLKEALTTTSSLLVKRDSDWDLVGKFPCVCVCVCVCGGGGGGAAGGMVGWAS